MLGYDELLTNFTDASLEMSGEFGQKMQETSKNDLRYKFSTKHKDQKGPLDSHT
jgi:hypothetical protein